MATPAPVPHPVHRATKLLRRKLDDLDRAIPLRSKGDTMQVEQDLLEEIATIIELLTAPNL